MLDMNCKATKAPMSRPALREPLSIARCSAQKVHGTHTVHCSSMCM
jgi:hypothetical protein